MLTLFDAIWAYGTMVSTNNYGTAVLSDNTTAFWSTEDFGHLTIGTTPISQLPSFITNFLCNQVIVVSGVDSFDWNSTELGFASISTSDAVALSKKYHNGKPYGEKISFGRGRNTASGKCVTATNYEYDTLSTNIDSNATFIALSRDSINCFAIFFLG